MNAATSQMHDLRAMEARRRRTQGARSSDCNVALRIAGALSILVIAFALPIIINADRPAPPAAPAGLSGGGAPGDALRADKHRDLYLNSGVQAVMAEMTAAYY